jgi:hypothetical protein
MSLRLPNSIGELTAKDRSNNGFWVSEISRYLLWMEYLAISPSYELARQVREGAKVDPSLLPSDFDQVLSVYDDLGNVQRALFRLWWKDVGLKHFGYKGTQPAVIRIGYTPHQTDSVPNLSSELAGYFEDEWDQQGRQRVMVFAVPVGLPEGKIMQQIKKQLARVKPERRTLLEPVAKYPLVGKRHHRDALMRYLRMAWLRSAMHKKALWRVGAQAKVSETYSPVLDPNMTEVSSADRFDREMLTIIASRALLRARMIAENAARGQFPTHEKCDAALEFDYPQLAKLIHQRNKWSKKEAERLNRQVDSG